MDWAQRHPVNAIGLHLGQSDLFEGPYDHKIDTFSRRNKNKLRICTNIKSAWPHTNPIGRVFIFRQKFLFMTYL